MQSVIMSPFLMPPGTSGKFCFLTILVILCVDLLVLSCKIQHMCMLSLLPEIIKEKCKQYKRKKTKIYTAQEKQSAPPPT